MKIEPFELLHPDGIQSSSFPGYQTQDGALCAITGSNGAGKTTMLEQLKTCPQLLGCNDEGDVVILDQIYERLLYPYKPVWWNIALPHIINKSLSSGQARELALHKLKSFQLDVEPDIYPEGLSGGEKHLVLLLRMSLCNHKILLLDEPASGVDASRVELLWNMVSHLLSSDGKKVILTAHRDFPPWPRNNPMSFSGIRGATLTIESMKIKE